MRKVRTRVWSTLIAVAMLLTMLPTVALAADSPKTIYVNASNTETNPDGSESSPYTTIAAAVEAASAGDTIKVVAVEGREYEPFELANLENLTIEGIPDAAGNKPVIKTNYEGSPVTVFQGCGAVVPGLGMDGLHLTGLEFKNYGYSDAWYSSSIALNGNTGANISGIVIDSCDFTVAENAPYTPNYAAFLNTDTFTFTNNTVVGYNNGVVCMADGSTLNTVEITGNTFDVTTNALYLYNGKYDSNAPGKIIFTNNTMHSGQIELWDYANSRVGQEDGGNPSIKTVITDVDTSEVPIITTAIDQGDTSFETENGNEINNVVFNYEDAKQALENTSNGDSFYIGYSADKGEGNTLYTKTAIDEYKDENGTVYNSWAAKLSSNDRTFDTIKAAVEAASDGDTLTISAGTHTITNAPLTISKRINLVGSGADTTTIVGAVQYQFSQPQEGNGLTVSGITFKAGSNAVQGLRFYGDKPNAGYNVKISVTDCAFEGWTYGITMNSHANGYDMTVSGCDFSKSLYAVSYNYDVTTAGQEADNSLTFGEGNTISENGFAVQKFNNINTGEGVVDNTYATIEEFVAGTPTISGRVVYVTSDLADAVSKASNGSTIIVAPGTYDGNITFGGKSLTIKAQYPAYVNGVKETDETKLSKFTGTFNTYGTDASSFNENQKIVIEGFAFSGNGLKVGNTNYNSVGTLEVRNCTMECGGNLEKQDKYNMYNHFVKISGSAGKPYASVVVEDNYVSGKLVTEPYTITPIQLWDVKSAVVRNNVIDVTECAAAQGINVSLMSKDADVEIAGNEISNVGGGIYVTTWKLGGESDNASAQFTGTITVKDNVLKCAESEDLDAIFLGYEEAASNDNPYGLLIGTQTVTGNTNNGEAVNAEIVRGPEGSTTTTITATFKDGDTVVGTVSGTPTNDKLSVTMPAALEKTGYTFKGWNDGTTTHDAGAAVTITADTTFTALWRRNSSGDIGVTTYSVTVEEAEHGTVTASPKSASQGTDVTLTVTPDEGYVLDTLTVKDASGSDVSVSGGNGVYTFKMPGNAVTVSAAFKAEEQDVETLPFKDVAEDDWFYEAVKYVYDNGMMNGTNDGSTFSPDMNLSRSMIAQVLYNLEGKPSAGAEGVFSDVAAGQWYTDAVNWAAANEIVKGYDNGKFGPEDDITREQMAVILYRYAQYKGYDVTAQGDLGTFNDGAETSDWAVEAMKWAVGSSLLQGYAGNLNPTGTATRAEVAQILMNFCENIAK
jgi:uncharacterized repeat protein (TIGR02543 family)